MQIINFTKFLGSKSCPFIKKVELYGHTVFLLSEDCNWNFEIHQYSHYISLVPDKAAPQSNPWWTEDVSTCFVIVDHSGSVIIGSHNGTKLIPMLFNHRSRLYLCVYKS